MTAKGVLPGKKLILEGANKTFLDGEEKKKIFGPDIWYLHTPHICSFVL
jgi:hypothetical protein